MADSRKPRVLTPESWGDVGVIKKHDVKVIESAKVLTTSCYAVHLLLRREISLLPSVSASCRTALVATWTWRSG